MLFRLFITAVLIIAAGEVTKASPPENPSPLFDGSRLQKIRDRLKKPKPSPQQPSILPVHIPNLIPETNWHTLPQRIGEGIVVGLFISFFFNVCRLASRPRGF